MTVKQVDGQEIAIFAGEPFGASSSFTKKKQSGKYTALNDHSSDRIMNSRVSSRDNNVIVSNGGIAANGKDLLNVVQDSYQH